MEKPTTRMLTFCKRTIISEKNRGEIKGFEMKRC